jgi:hypothetical protein
MSPGFTSAAKHICNTSLAVISVAVKISTDRDTFLGAGADVAEGNPSIFLFEKCFRAT